MRKVFLLPGLAGSLLRLAGLTSLLSAGPALAMEFATIPVDSSCNAAECRRAVIAEGEITREAPTKFAAFLRQELQRPGLHAIVFLNSPGGNVESALQLGSLIHDAGAAVVIGRPALFGASGATRRKAAVGQVGVVPGHCASACVYVLMGAKKRVVPEGARLGVHRMSARMWRADPAGGSLQGERIYAGSTEVNALRQYVSRVGGSQDLISLAESVPHDQIRILSSNEVRRFRLGAPSL
jgi:hypothetical protein